MQVLQSCCGEKVTINEVSERTMAVGVPKSRWENNAKTDTKGCESKEWSQLFQDRVNCWDLMIVVTDFQAP
jgi:hypothetical protein